MMALRPTIRVRVTSDFLMRSRLDLYGRLLGSALRADYRIGSGYPG